MVKSLNSATLRRRAPLVGSSRPKLTDQSAKESTMIQNIVKNYLKTGQLPQSTNHQYAYVDDVNRPTFEEMHTIKQNANQLFQNLPSELRNEIQNDPNKLETWLSNPKNLDDAEKYGLIKKRQKIADKKEQEVPNGNSSTVSNTNS